MKEKPSDQEFIGRVLEVVSEESISNYCALPFLPVDSQRYLNGRKMARDIFGIHIKKKGDLNDRIQLGLSQIAKYLHSILAQNQVRKDPSDNYEKGFKDFHQKLLFGKSSEQYQQLVPLCKAIDQIKRDEYSQEEADRWNHYIKINSMNTIFDGRTFDNEHHGFLQGFFLALDVFRAHNTMREVIDDLCFQQELIKDRRYVPKGFYECASSILYLREPKIYTKLYKQAEKSPPQETIVLDDDSTTKIRILALDVD